MQTKNPKNGKSPARRFAEKLLIWMINAAAVTVVFYLVCILPIQLAKWQPDEFSGRVVDKMITIGESQEGSYFGHILIVEDSAHARHRVSVPEEMYNRAALRDLIDVTRSGIKVRKPEKSDGKQ
jgi:hypothetical protein